LHLQAEAAAAPKAMEAAAATAWHIGRVTGGMLLLKVVQKPPSRRPGGVHVGAEGQGRRRPQSSRFSNPLVVTGGPALGGGHGQKVPAVAVKPQRKFGSRNPGPPRSQRSAFQTTPPDGLWEVVTYTAPNKNTTLIAPNPLPRPPPRLLCTIKSWPGGQYPTSHSPEPHSVATNMPPQRCGVREASAAMPRGWGSHVRLQGNEHHP
jgi:hypothetical protein